MTNEKVSAMTRTSLISNRIVVVSLVALSDCGVMGAIYVPYERSKEMKRDGDAQKSHQFRAMDGRTVKGYTTGSSVKYIY